MADPSGSEIAKTLKPYSKLKAQNLVVLILKCLLFKVVPEVD